MFELTDQPIDAAMLRARLVRPDAGACVVFEGWVRDHHAGRPVTLLEYEAFDELARLEGEAIVTEAEGEHPGCVVLCVHRTGALPVGELAVWIGVASPHRHAAFLACRQVIEAIKRRLPVWKKEHHPGGVAEWVNCTTEPTAPPARCGRLLRTPGFAARSGRVRPGSPRLSQRAGRRDWRAGMSGGALSRHVRGGTSDAG